MFSCFVFSLGCVWQHFRPTTSATTGKPFMVCSMGTAMWKCPICCSAPWATSWQKSCRKQRTRRNTWSTLSLLCRGESWICSFFDFWSGTRSCFKKYGGGGGKPWYLAIMFLFIACFGNIASVPFRCRKKNPSTSPTKQKNPNPPSKLLKCSWLSGWWRFIPFWYLLRVLRFTIGYNQVSGMNVLIIFLNFLATAAYRAWTHPFCFCQCTSSGYLRVHKYLKHIVWLLRNPFGLWILFEQDSSRELVIK